jgi:hypothetical protein
MITLDLARKLKDAGLEWEPKKFDLYNTEFINGSNGVFSVWHDGQNLESTTGTTFTWLPSLSQLLAEIEGRGYRWSLEKVNEGYESYVTKDIDDCNKDAKYDLADTPEEAAGKALLWVLERGDING